MSPATGPTASPTASPTLANSGTECDVFFFEVGGQVFGADPTDVLRIDRSRPELLTAMLQLPVRSARVMVVRGIAGEVQVPVDTVLGVRRVGQLRLRRTPTFLQLLGGNWTRWLLGLVLREDEDQPPVVVVDLKALCQQVQPPTPLGTPRRPSPSEGRTHG
jgi:hypothetical protein